MWSDVLAFLPTARFVDLLLPGWVDRTGPFPVCRPLALSSGVYLQAESGLIQLTSVNGNGGLRLRLASQIDYDEDLRNDPDEDLVAASVAPDLWLAEHRSPRLQQIFGPLKETTWLPPR